MNDHLLVSGLLVVVVSPDRKLRMAPLTPKQAARLRRFVTQLHGGSLHVDPKELFLLSEADALETFGRLTGKVPIKQRLLKWAREWRIMKEAPVASEAETPKGQNEPQECPMCGSVACHAYLPSEGIEA